MAEKTAMDAINEALGTAASGEPDPNAPLPADNPPPSDPPADSPPGDDEPPADSPPGDDEPPADEEVDPKTGKPVEKGPNGERERNPDGTWKKAEEKKPDPVNDPIPKELKAETRERMTSLINTVKEKDTQLTEVKQNFDYMVGGIQATGATPEQYGETLSWLALFNSGKPESQLKALELVESVADRLATLLGKDRTVNDPLKAHADLQEAIRTKQITPELAKEIARTRNGQQFRTELTTTAQTRQDQVNEAQRIENQARTDLTSLEDALRSVDGKEYDSIKATIVPVLKPLMAAINPSQWKEKFSAAYKAEKDRRAAVKASSSARAKPPVSQPLRAGKNPAGGQARPPSNAAEVLNAALASMGK